MRRLLLRPVVIMATVLGIALLILLVTTSKLFDHLAVEVLDREVNQRTVLAQELARLNLPPGELVRLVDGGEAYTLLVLNDGRRLTGRTAEPGPAEFAIWRVEQLDGPGQYKGAGVKVASTNRASERRMGELRQGLAAGGLIVFGAGTILLYLGLRLGLERLAARTIATAVTPSPLITRPRRWWWPAPTWPQSWSVHRRVVVMAVVVLLVPLVAVAAAMVFAFQSAQFSALEAATSERMQYAQKLAENQTPPRDLVRHLDQGNTRVGLVTATGEVYGSLPESEASIGGGPKRVGYVYQRQTVFKVPGPLNNATFTLQFEGGVPEELLSYRVLSLLTVIALIALIFTVVILILGTRIALGPLTVLTGIAARIASGDRGARVPPLATDRTEIGRATSAFNAMLDDIEGAESRAKDAEQKTRRFVADAAHELRTPIAGVQAAAEAVLRQPADATADERDRLHLLLIRESQRAGLLVDDLLNLARIDAGDFVLHRAPTDVAELVQQQAERIALLHPGLEVRVPNQNAVRAEVDAGRVSQILANLLNNAANATADGGLIGVSVADVAGLVRVTVTDNGIGVPVAERERIFDRLVRLDAARGRKTGGHGLGLAISRELARAHGGDLVCADPEPGVSGAIFVLTLPVGAP